MAKFVGHGVRHFFGGAAAHGKQLPLGDCFGPTADATTPTVPAWLMQSTSAVVIILFFTLFWRKSGQTLGMQAWRIKLETVEGEAPSIMQCVTRCAVAVLSLGACGLGYWWSFFDSKGRRWHDIASKTRLVLVPKPQEK